MILISSTFFPGGSIRRLVEVDGRFADVLFRRLALGRGLDMSLDKVRF